MALQIIKTYERGETINMVLTRVDGESLEVYLKPAANGLAVPAESVDYSATFTCTEDNDDDLGDIWRVALSAENCEAAFNVENPNHVLGYRITAASGEIDIKTIGIIRIIQGIPQAA
jgi:hypothetical protein